MEMIDINWLAVLVCGLSSMLLGAIWYSPLLFGRAWQRAAGLGDEDLARGNLLLIYGLAFLLSLAAATLLALAVGRITPVGFATGMGAAVGLLWVAASFGINYLFERRSLAHWLINGGYHVLQFTVFGLILGLFA